jgi:hypothetical protein
MKKFWAKIKKSYVLKWRVVKAFLSNVWDSETISVKNIVSNFVFKIGTAVAKSINYLLLFVLFLFMVKYVSIFLVFVCDKIIDRKIPIGWAQIAAATFSIFIWFIVNKWIEKLKKLR